MSDPTPPADEAVTRRAERLAAIVAELAAVHQPLASTMTEEEFRATIARMAEHQLLYEEYGHEGR